MTTAITKKLMCVQMRSGVEIWVEEERIQKLQTLLDRITGTKFITFDDQTINTADIVGIFLAPTMHDYTRRKNGEWKCQNNHWHGRGEKCNCLSMAEQELIKRRSEAIRNCKLGCNNGYRKTISGMIECECVENSRI
jgi:hypothetical protein